MILRHTGGHTHITRYLGKDGAEAIIPKINFMNEEQDQINQLKARVKELEDAMYEISKAAYNVTRYFAEKCNDIKRI